MGCIIAFCVFAGEFGNRVARGSGFTQYIFRLVFFSCFLSCGNALQREIVEWSMMVEGEFIQTEMI